MSSLPTLSTPTPLSYCTAPLLSLFPGIGLCFLIFYPLPAVVFLVIFAYPVSASLLTFHLSASGCSVNYHIFFLYVSFPLFLSLRLVCPWGNPSTTMLSVTALPHHLLRQHFLCHFVSSPYRLLILLPSMSPCQCCSNFQSQTIHTCKHTPSDPANHTWLYAAPCLSQRLPPSLPPRYFFPPSLHLSNFPTHLFSPSAFSWFLSSPPKLSFLFLLTQRLTLSFIWCSSSVMEEISFTTRAVQYWSFLAHKLDVTDLLSCWSIRAKEIDSTLSHSFTLTLFLSLFSSSMLSLHLFSLFNSDKDASSKHVNPISKYFKFFKLWGVFFKFHIYAKNKSDTAVCLMHYGI